jgi:hypothetical protein
MNIVRKEHSSLVGHYGSVKLDCLLHQPLVFPLFSSYLHTAQYRAFWVIKLLPKPVIASSGRGSTIHRYSSHLTSHNWLFLLIVDDFFWKKRVRGTSCFLPHQKILILAKVMTGWRSALMCYSIVCVIYQRDYLKILIFDLQILSSSKFFEQSTSYLADTFLMQFRRELVSSIFELGL